MKCNLTDHGTGVMLMLRGPNGFGGGKVVDAMVNHIDIFPTLCDMLDIDRPIWLQGRSLIPLVDGTVDKLHDFLFSEITYHAAYEPQRAIRTPRWKYIRRFDNYPHPVLPNCDGGPAKDQWLAHGWQDHELPYEQLYDLIFDPNEAHNLADDPEHLSLKIELGACLEAWMETTNDPLINGPIPHCEGCRTTPVDAHDVS
jgi:arylsulfatase A-like enzyme